MKERPILFSPAMALAVREDRKSQTRRTIKNQPPAALQQSALGDWLAPGYVASWTCPYGVPGDRLYVREEYYQMGHWELVAGAKTKGGRPKWAFIPSGEPEYVPSGPYSTSRPRDSAEARKRQLYKRLARFMPRKYSLTTLEITGIRVERLQAISESDAIAEGIIKFKPAMDRDYQKHMVFGLDKQSLWYRDSAVEFYRTLWDSINGPGSFDLNPFVWVVEFRRMEGGASS